MHLEATMDLNRNKAIEMICKWDAIIRFETSIDCSQPLADVESELYNNIDWDCFKRECIEKAKEITKQKKKFSKLATHEIYEIGEEKGYWKCSEKQKRLIEQ